MLERFKKSDSYGHWLNLLLTCLYVWYLFRTLLLSPAHTFLSTGGDGAKNYFTFLFHVLYGKGFHFDGMNYPWGEHISFTDNQPLLALPFAGLQSVLHLSVNQLLALMNLIIILSFILTSHLIFRFLRSQGVIPLLAAVFGLLITFLWPGFARVFGHFGLCYTFHIVFTIHCLFQYRATNKRRYAILLFAICFAMAFVHMYNLLLCMIIIFLFALAGLLIERGLMKKQLLQSGILFAIVILSFAAAKLVFMFTDPVRDRPQNPWGILQYVSSLKQLFTSDFSYLGKTFSLFFDGYVTTELDEGYAYAGLVSLCYIIYIALNCVFYFFRKSSVNLYSPLPKAEQYLIVIAAGSWLIAIGFPFTFGMENLLDLMPAIKQFRSLGRLSVITYFCFALSSALAIGRLTKCYVDIKRYQTVLYLSLLIIGMWTLEVFSYSKYLQRRADDADTNYQNFFQLHSSKDPVVVQRNTEYQCILGLPFFCIGSEKLGKDVDSEFSGDLFRLSLTTGLPIVNTLMSRSSWKQSFQLMRLAGGPFTDKTYFTTSINQKPILVVRLKEAYMSDDEQSLMALCDSVGEQGRIVLYRMNWQELIQKQQNLIDSLNHLPLSTFQQKNVQLAARHFDEEKAEEVFFGSGALDIRELDTVLLMDQAIKADSHDVFEFSVWARAVSTDYRMPHCVVILYDSSGAEISHDLVHAQHSVDNVGFWFRIAAEIRPDMRARKVKILYRNNADHAAVSLDEFLFKPLQSMVVQEDLQKGIRLYNNHLVSLKSPSTIYANGK